MIARKICTSSLLQWVTFPDNCVNSIICFSHSLACTFENAVFFVCFFTLVDSYGGPRPRPSSEQPFVHVTYSTNSASLSPAKKEGPESGQIEPVEKGHIVPPVCPRLSPGPQRTGIESSLLWQLHGPSVDHPHPTGL
ncbi:hypothetical protein CRENBAI_001543 [Crenichthys baileyi]|uniref:Uncharacterized protein n=1 Tax=Crenichthys baileyi TaxID=28760 RepID=A0AAV9RVL3_9TELE